MPADVTDVKPIHFMRDQYKSGRTRVTLINADTGAVESSYWEHQTGKPSGRPRGKSVQFYRLYRTNWQDVVRNKRVTFYELGVLTALLTFAEWDTNRIIHPDKGTPLTLTELARLMSMDRKQLAKVMDELERGGFVSWQNGAFVLNSQVCFFGKYLTNEVDHATFSNGECGYTPAVEVKYRAKD